MSRLVKSSNMFVISKNMFRRETPLRCFIDGRLVLLIFILCFLVASTEAAGKMKAIRPRDTLLTGVCENVTGSNYQNYVSYNQKRRYVLRYSETQPWLGASMCLFQSIDDECITTHSSSKHMQLLSRWDHRRHLHARGW